MLWFITILYKHTLHLITRSSTQHALHTQLMASSGGKIKWLSDLDKFVLVSNFEKRGWIKGSSEGNIIMYVSIVSILPIHL